MSKILKSLQFVTQSASPSTPAAGTGALFASGSGSGASIYFENTDGTVYDLAATNGYIVTQSYTGSTNGTDVTYQWSVAPGLKYLEICCIGGGGGGASGRVTITTPAGTSTGGGGGAIVRQLIEAARLTGSPYTITIGQGGTPGSARSAVGSAIAGLNGTAGGNTSFGTLVIAAGGAAGSNAGGLVLGGQVSNCTPSFGPWALQGCTSGNAATTTTNDARDSFDYDALPVLNAAANLNNFTQYGNGGGGGGCGGGRQAGGVFAGSRGSGVVLGNIGTSITLGGAGGAANSNGPGGAGGTGQDNIGVGTLMLFSSSFILTNGLGTGGGGGGCGTTAGGNGGNAGYYGCGGGGGGNIFGLGSALVPSSSGAGGSGSSGLCVLIEYY